MSSKTLYIIRGVPGSGKSTLAHQLTKNVVETDDFMMVDGEYKYDKDKVYACHKKCYNKVLDYMAHGVTPIAVANTFIKKKDYKPYVDLAKEFEYNVEIKVCKGDYKNVHNVPQDRVEQMKSKFQESINSILEMNDDIGIIEAIENKKQLNINDNFKKWFGNSKSINESFVKNPFTNEVECYYSKSESEVKQIVKNLFKDIPVRILYDFKNEVYIFGNANDKIHIQLLEIMNSYGKFRYPSSEEKMYEYMDKYCAMFKIINTNDYKSYSRSDGYKMGIIGKLDTDMYVILRDNTLAIERSSITGKFVPDELVKCKKVPMLKNVKFVNYDIRGTILKSKEQLPQNLVNESFEPKLNDNFKKWFGNSKCVDKNGNPKVFIHRSNAKFNAFDKSKIGQRDYGWYGKGFYFGSAKQKDYKLYGKHIYKCFLRIENPFYYNEFFGSYTPDDYQKIVGYNKLGILTPQESDFLKKYMVAYNHFDFNVKLKKVPQKVKGYNGKVYDSFYWIAQYNGKTTKTDPDKNPDYNTEDYAKEMFWREHYGKHIEKIKEINHECYKTRMDKMSNSIRNMGYDGIINADEYVVFEPTQIKSVKNNGNWSLEVDNINEEKEVIEERLFPEISDRKYNELLWFTSPNMTANAYTKFFGKEMIADRIPAKYLVTLSSNDISLKDLVEKHKKLYNAKQVKPIADYKDFNDFITDLNKSKYLSRNDKSNIAKSGAKIIRSFGDWDLYDITTWEAAKKYGSGTTWCVTDSTSDDYFKRYTNRLPFNNYQTEEDMKKSIRSLLFLINPNTDRKMAISVYKRMDYDWYGDEIEFYNEEDEFFYTYRHSSDGGISLKDNIMEKISYFGDDWPDADVVEDYGVTEDFINNVTQFIKDAYRMNKEQIVEDINKLRQKYKKLMNIKESANNSTNMTWEEFVEKVGRENEFDGSVVISKHNTSIIIRQSGRILVRKLGKKPFMKAYSNLKTFDEIYNMLVEKGFVEEQILTEAVNQHSLYHGCDLGHAVSMMINNAMRGETIAHINGKQYQGNSLTRSLQFAKDWKEERFDGYGDELTKFWVVLELNKERLKTKYKVLPYNYWEEYFGKDYEHTIDRNGYGDQYEEFVVGRINNLRNYLDDVYLSDECLHGEYAEILAIVKRELELRGEDYSESDIEEALQQLGIHKPSPDDFDGEKKLNENYDGMPMVYPNPTYAEFHDIMRRFTTTGKLSAIIDGDDIYCWDSYLKHHEIMVKYIENKMDIKFSDNAKWVRFKEPNICWVSAAYFDDYDDDELEDLETQDFEEELKYNPVIRKYFPKGVKVVRYDRLDEEYEGLNRIAGFYWFDEHKFQMLKRKPVGVDELSDDDDEFDYYHLEKIDGLIEDNKARFGIEKLGKEIVCYIEAETKSKCLRAKRAILRKYPDIVFDRFDLSWENNGFETLNEEIVYAEMNNNDMLVILHNPTRKELKDNHLDDECRIVYDGNNGYYFASSEWTHEQIEQKLQANNLPYTETNGEFYYYQDNLFATRDDWSSEEEYQEYKNDWYQSLKSMPYIVKNFGNFKVEIFKDEYLSESVYPENKYVFPRPDWGNLADIIDPNDEYRYWVDGVQAKIEKPYKKYIPVDKIRQDYDGDDMYEYDYSQFDGEINEPIDVLKYKDQYILMDGHHRAAYSKVNGLKTIKAYVYDVDELEQLDESIAFGKMVNDKMITILKNPTRNELKKNGINYARIVVDDYGNIYFGPAKRYSHAMIVGELERNNISEFKILGPDYDWGIDVFLYDQTTNTFYYRVDYMSKEEEKKKLESAKDFLNTNYFNKSFGDFNVQTTDKEEPWEK